MAQKKQTKKATKKNESGRSMIEMVGVLAVMGLITAAAFVLITSAMKQQKLSRGDDDVAAIVAGVRLLYNNAEDFSRLTSENSAGTLEVLGFASVKSPYGTDYNLAVNSDTTKFDISFDADKHSTCVALAGRTWPSNGQAKCGESDGDKTVTITYDSGK